jgi:hypothetical protein
MADENQNSAKALAKQKKNEAIKRAGVTLLPASPIGVYPDGAPFDQVQYLEAKLILKPDNFTSVQAFRDFGAIVKRTAEDLGVGFIEHPEMNLRPEIREIVFGARRISGSTTTPSSFAAASAMSTVLPWAIPKSS